MGKATLAYQRAIGEIGVARAARLTEAGLIILWLDEYQRLKARVAELEKENATLREIALNSEELRATARMVQEALSK